MSKQRVFAKLTRQFGHFTHPFIQVLMAASIYQWIFFIQYFNFSPLEKMSWISDDSLSILSSHILRDHTFSDWQIPLLDAQKSNSWITNGNVYSPVVMIFFRLLTFSNKITGIRFSLILLIAIALITFAVISKNLGKNGIPIALWSFTTFPLIAAIDRGNVILLLPPILYFFYLNYTRARIWQSCFYLAIAISIKPYFGLFLLYFLIRKQHKLAFNTGLLYLIMNIIASLYWGNPILIAKALIKNILVLNTAVPLTSQSLISINSNFFAILEKFGLHKDQTKTILLISTLSTFLLILASILIVKRFPEKYWIVLSLTLLALLPPLNYSYCGIILVTSLLIMLNIYNCSKNDYRLKNKSKKVDVLETEAIHYVIISVVLICSFFYFYMGNIRIIGIISIFFYFKAINKFIMFERENSTHA